MALGGDFVDPASVGTAAPDWCPRLGGCSWDPHTLLPWVELFVYHSWLCWWEVFLDLHSLLEGSVNLWNMSVKRERLSLWKLNGMLKKVSVEWSAPAHNWCCGWENCKRTGKGRDNQTALRGSSEKQKLHLVSQASGMRLCENDREAFCKGKASSLLQKTENRYTFTCFQQKRNVYFMF